MSGGIFSGREIVEARRTGQVIIDPFDPKRVQSSSVDVTLGEWFYVAVNPPEGIINPYDADSREKCFKGPLRAITHEEWAEKRQRKPLKNVPLHKRIIELRPGERILAHTEEFIGIAYGGTTMMHAKSTTGRWGVAVCYDAGWGDEGYFNRWTMEINNHNHTADYPLIVGEPIAQLIFFKMPESGDTYSRTGHYQKNVGLERLKEEWDPSMMLPRVQTLE